MEDVPNGTYILRFVKGNNWTTSIIFDERSKSGTQDDIMGGFLDMKLKLQKFLENLK